jgi:gluconolactonase
MRMRTLLAIVAAAATAAAGPALSKVERPGPDGQTMGTIHRDDPAFDKLVPPNAKIEKLADGFDWAEGPVWIKEGGYLLFSDIPKNSIFKWKEGEGKSLFLKPSGYSGKKPRGGEPGTNALLRDPAGNLVACEHGDRRVSRIARDGAHTPLASSYQGKRLNSPNDAVFKSNGDLYFTDPPYGLEKNWDDPARELDFCGVYRVTPDGKVTLLTRELSRPNGLAFSPDEKTLYVANSDYARPVWMAFDVKADGTLGKGRVFYDASEWIKEKKPGLPDGMKVDEKGNVFATGPGGVHVFTPEGKHLGSIDPGVATANCAWGDDGSTLYMTADKNLCRIKLSTSGKIPGKKE